MAKNHKQLLADFYLDLLAIPKPNDFNRLKAEVRYALSELLGEDQETVQRIFERMANEDADRTN